MGYGQYELPDGRDAGYNVEALCDKTGCDTKIHRGLGHLCGTEPDGYRSLNEYGCGKYFCDTHLYDDHNCPNPRCGKYSTDGMSVCNLATNHAGAHKDLDTEESFTETEED